MTRSALREALIANDLERAIAAIASDHDPRLRPSDVIDRLDALAQTIAPNVRGAPGITRLGKLVQGVYRDLEFREPEGSYEDPELHLIDRVIERRTGSPVALAVVLMTVGRRLGVPLSGVAFPGHFMVRYEAREPVFLDPATGNFPFPASTLQQLAADELKVSQVDASRFLMPIGVRAIVVRLLQNLERAHEERGDLGHALLAADRLFDVTGSASARCDRGLRAAQLGAPHAALDDLTAYLRDHRDADVSRTAARLRPTPHHLN